MLSVKMMKATIILGVLLLTMALVAVALNDPQWAIPIEIASGLRVLVMSEAAFVIGIIILLLVRGSRIKISRDDNLSRYVFAWLISYMMMVGFTVLQMASLLSTPAVTYRTPFAAVTLAIGGFVMFRIAGKLSYMFRKGDTGIYKLTITDTSKPGPDIDIGTGVKVVPQSPIK